LIPRDPPTAGLIPKFIDYFNDMLADR